jgi:PRC-barrel domain
MSKKPEKLGAKALRAFGAQSAAIALSSCLMIIMAAQTPADAALAQATSRAPPSAAAPQRALQEGTPATVIDSDQAEGIIGMQVRSASGADMGRIVDLVVDRAGHVRAAVIDFGGFLGVGTRQIAVDWSALHFPPTGSMDSLVVDLDGNQLKLAPIYKAGEPIVVLGGSSAPAQRPVLSPRAAAPQKHP